MRLVGFLIAVFVVFAMAYWAYDENYKTRALRQEISTLQYDIAKERDAISMLMIEWANLTAPERLEDLVKLTFNDLQIHNIGIRHYHPISEIPMLSAPQEAE